MFHWTQLNAPTKNDLKTLLLQKLLVQKNAAFPETAEKTICVQVGRVREGQYELPQLNGWLSPDRAAARCARHPRCGGFTYKGFITEDPTQQFNIFFFQLLLNYESSAESWNWVTYKVQSCSL